MLAMCGISAVTTVNPLLWCRDLIHTAYELNVFGTDSGGPTRRM